MFDEKSWSDFLSANSESLGEELVSEATTFRNRLMVANRLWKTSFSGLSDNPQTPGELQGTLMMLKLMDGE